MEKEAVIKGKPSVKKTEKGTKVTKGIKEEAKNEKKKTKKRTKKRAKATDGAKEIEGKKNEQENGKA